jgi:hypothetical protein
MKSQAKNSKISYPPKIEGYISSRLFKEELSDFLIKKGYKEIDITNIVNSTAKRFKLFAEESGLSKTVIAEGVRGKEQFSIKILQKWLLDRRTEIKDFRIKNAN